MRTLVHFILVKCEGYTFTGCGSFQFGDNFPNNQQLVFNAVVAVYTSATVDSKSGQREVYGTQKKEWS